MRVIRGRFEATDSLDMQFNRILNWDALVDLPQDDAEVGQALVWTGSRWAPGTVSESGVVVVTWDDIEDKPSVFTPDDHTHPWSEVTGKPTVFTPDTHTHTMADISDLDVGVTTLSAGTGINLSTSTGAVTITCDVTWDEVGNKPSVFTPDTHTHTMADITDLSGVILTACKTQNQQKASDTSLALDNALYLTMQTWTEYKFEMLMRWDAHTTADLKFDIGVGTDMACKYGYDLGGGTADEIDYSAVQTLAGGGVGTIKLCRLTGFAWTGTYSGTIGLRWAQNSSTSLLTLMRAGSWFTLTPVGKRAGH